MPEISLARNLIIVLLTAFVGGTLARKLRFPLLIGYLVSGVFIGTFLDSYFSLGETIRNIAEVGIILLLFTLGLEFSLTKLRVLGEVIIFGSLIQVLSSMFVSVLVFPFLGMDFYTSLFLGTVFSLSSTALSIKTLSDKGEMETLHGELSSGWLFMQDLYTLPIMILLPTIGIIMKGESPGIITLFVFLKSLMIASVSFLAVIYIGNRLIPLIVGKIADFRSRELLLVFSVLFCFIFAFIFQYFGLTYALGAFIAGILLSSSSAHHGIFAEVRPLRDLFSTVFFVSLGLMLNVAHLWTVWPTILILVLFVVLSKFLISAFLVFILGYHMKTAVLVGFSMVSVGEFAFILASIGLFSNLISQEIYMIVLSVTFVTLTISVPLQFTGDKIYYFIRQIVINRIPKLHFLIARLGRLPISVSPSMTNHVVILGHGRVGKHICRALDFLEVPFLVVDYNHKLVKYLRERGINVIYGDPAETDVLNFANVKNAKAVILAYADRHTQESVVVNILTINPNVKIICRVHFDEDQNKLRSLGVDSVIQPEFEAAISMTEKLLNLLYTDNTEAEKKLKNFKSMQVME